MQNSESALPKYAIESVHNALTILLMFRSGKSIRLVDASNQLGVSRSTAHRMLQTLVYDGFVEQNPTTKLYRLGPALRELAVCSTHDADVLRIARPHIEALVLDINETVNLIAPEGNNVRFVDGVESTHAIRVTSRLGFLRPAHVTSAGKIFLAEMNEQQLESYLSSGLVKLTDSTFADEQSLRNELDLIRRNGYALNRGEGDESIHAVAVPVRDPGGRAVAGLAVSVPPSKGGTARLRSFIPVLRHTAAAIEAEL